MINNTSKKAHDYRLHLPYIYIVAKLITNDRKNYL